MFTNVDMNKKLRLNLIYFQGIIYAICRGFVDSLKGAVVLFYMDKQINEKLVRKSPTRSEIRRRDVNSPAKHNKLQKYIYCQFL